jgi:hypothetical protein
MGVVKKFIDELAKHKLLIYFAILWGASMFFWSLYDIGYYVTNFSDAMDALPVLYNLMELGAGLFLALFGIKLLQVNFLKTLDNEKVLVYFLLLWAGSLFFSGLYDIVDFGPYIFECWEDILGFIGALADFFGGAVLALFTWNLLSKKEPDTTQ